MRIAIVGATGLVGREMIRVLEEFDLPVEMLIPAASDRSAGQSVFFNGKKMKVVSVKEAVEAKPDMAIFSAGAEVSKKWAPVFAESGTTVIDNSSAWRMNVDVPLIVPEINAAILTKNDKIIANPNCSTIQLVMVLAPLQKRYGIKRVVVSTYQSVTGSGVKAVEQLMSERNDKSVEKFYPHTIDLNVLPHAGDFETDGYTTEELKLVNETRKILNVDIPLTATAARVPVVGGHSEAVNAELEKDFDIEEVKQLLAKTKGIVLEDNPDENRYPMPMNAKGNNEVFVGRVRRDFSVEHGINLWIVADNIRKGAATNAVQIAAWLIQNNLTTR
ncbi:MAG: aspartate-semialdehyde dehydrogenase [Bacteroidetes bacterium]|nr:MAG: aspartate-semialdehyde dehydrogenase [Bacteroidota bacterium]